jgi:hypothetical protein
MLPSLGVGLDRNNFFGALRSVCSLPALRRQWFSLSKELAPADLKDICIVNPNATGRYRSNILTAK